MSAGAGGKGPASGVAWEPWVRWRWLVLLIICSRGREECALLALSSNSCTEKLCALMSMWTVALLHESARRGPPSEARRGSG